MKSLKPTVPKTLQQAREYRYGKWAGCPNGNAYQDGYCIEEIIPNERASLPRQCGGRGVPYCSIHRPGAAEERAVKRPPTRYEREVAAMGRREKQDPENDIPNGYSVGLHRALDGTIARPSELNLGLLRAMACHHSKVGEEIACAGWLHNQIGAGNNIGVRIAGMRGNLPVPVIDGEQHERFEDTLP